MKLSRLLHEAGYDTKSAPLGADPEIADVASDTRTVKRGSLFVAMRGRRVDSHTLIEEAARRGAAAAVVESDRCAESQAIPLVPIRNTRTALARLADALYGHPASEMTLVGVTGTNGKTSVSYLLSAILEEAGRRVGMIGTVTGRSCGRTVTYENGDPTAHMTTPDPPVLYRMLSEMRADGCDTVVMEATSHASALGKLDPLEFDLLIFTNLSRDHLDFHTTPEAYFRAKARLFLQTERALVNLDGSAVFGDPVGYGRAIAVLARESGAVLKTCSEETKNDPDFGISGLTENENGIRFYFRERGREALVIESPLHGRYNAMNLLESAAAARMLGIDGETIGAALKRFSTIPGRMERVPLPEGAGFTVWIDFAHTPDGLENLLRAAHGFRKENGRIVLLFGCGGDRDRSKRWEMAHIASRMADFIYITDDNSRSEDPGKIINDILKGIDKEKPHAVIPSRREAIRRAVLDAKRGDVILLAGKGHEQYNIDKDGTHTFCESEIVKAAYRERRGEQTDRTEE